MNAASWLEGLPAQERWRTLLLSEGPRIATWALSLGLGVQAAFIVTDLAGGGAKAAAGASAAAASRAAAMRSHQLNLVAITNAHLFGAAPAAQQDPATAPATSMALVLTGIIAGNDPQNGLAILGANAQSARVYAVGDTIAGGPKLHSVYTDRVIIDRNGQLESLTLPHQMNPNAPPPSAAMLQGGENPALEHMRRMITEQPGLIGDVIRPQPVMDRGRMNGFRVYPGRDRAAFLRLGLRPGDQVTAINGTPLDDRDRSEEILKTLSSASEAHVTVLRGGQTQDLQVNIAQLAQETDNVAAQAATGVPPPNAAAAASAAAEAAQGTGAVPPPSVPAAVMPQPAAVPAENATGGVPPPPNAGETVWPQKAGGGQ